MMRTSSSLRAFAKTCVSRSAVRFHSGSAATSTGSTHHKHGPGCSCCQSTEGSSRTFSSSPGDKPVDRDIAQLLKNNEDWVKQSQEKDPDFFKRIGGPQKPKYLYIGCADSRVPANEILGLGPGEVFVHRNVGNLVNGSDLNVLSAIEFAVEHLKVEHIIVTGHYDCGAVRASMAQQDLGLLENWIRSIRDVHRIHHEEMSLITDAEDKHKRLVELNVIEQCVTLFKTGVVQRKRKEYRDASKSQPGDPVFPKIHGMVFDPKVGLLKKLPVNFSDIVRNYQHIYNLY